MAIPLAEWLVQIEYWHRLGRAALEETRMELLARLGLKPETFAGQTAVVTGAAKGIGEQVARGLGALGAHVIVLDIDERGEDVAAQVRGNQRSAEFAKVDLRDLEQLERDRLELGELGRPRAEDFDLSGHATVLRT